ARTHQLLVHNKELLEHIAALVAHLQDRERGSSRSAINAQQLTMLPQGHKITQNLENNNLRSSPFDVTSTDPATPKNGPGMTHDFTG
ncbi:hypothetical protein EVAR_101481_1, partial [Eumeta japonica]